MESNGQQKTTRGVELLLQADCQPRQVAVGQHGRGCLERGTESTAHWAAWRGHGAFATFAVPGPVMRMIASTRRAVPLKCCVAMTCREVMLAFAGVRMACAAAHLQVNHQHRADQDAGRPGHETPHLPVIHHRHHGFAIFRRIGQLVARGHISSPPILGSTLQTVQRHVCCAPISILRLTSPQPGSVPCRNGL